MEVEEDLEEDMSPSQYAPKDKFRGKVFPSKDYPELAAQVMSLEAKMQLLLEQQQELQMDSS